MFRQSERKQFSSPVGFLPKGCVKAIQIAAQADGFLREKILPRAGFVVGVDKTAR